MSNCNGCCGNCGGCGELVLAPEEVDILLLLAQVAFLPVMRTADSPDPLCPDIAGQSPEQAGLYLQCLEKRGLITIDFDRPLSGCKGKYANYPIQGSCGLTARGQELLTLMDIQGLSEE